MCTRVGPYDGVVQWLASLAVPADSGFALVRDADRFDAFAAVALFFKVFHGAVNAFLNGADDFGWVVFMPAKDHAGRKYAILSRELGVDELTLAVDRSA